MHDIVPFIILAIICTQVFFFIKNLMRMGQFSKIFSEENLHGVFVETRRQALLMVYMVQEIQFSSRLKTL